MALSDIVVDIAGSADGLKKSVKNSEGVLDGFQNRVKKISNAMKASFATVTSALGKIFGVASLSQLFRDGAVAAKVQIDAEKKLAAVLKATGNSAGVTAEEMKKLASERQGATNFGDESTIDATAILATFKEIKGDQFREAIPLMQDMAAVMGSDLSSTAVQFGKALNDPVAGVGALSRVGVQFTHQQKEMIKSLVESNQLAKAQGVVMTELKSQFGGAAAAMADPITQANNAWGDFLEQLGMIFNEIKVAAMEAFGFTDAMNSANNMAETFRSEWLPSIKSVIFSISKFFKIAIDIWKSLWNSWVGASIKEIFFIAENWDTFLLIAVERLKLFVSNGIARVKNFFSNFRSC